MTNSPISTDGLADQAKQQASSLKHSVGASAMTQLGTQKQRATAGLGQISDALHQTGSQLRQQQSPAGEYLDRAALQVDRVGGYLQQNEVREIFTDIEGFARRQPAVVMGGALVLGFLASRFVKSSHHSAAQTGSSQPGTLGGGPTDARMTSSYSSSYRPAPMSAAQPGSR